MTTNGWLQIALFSLVVLALARPLGTYLVRVYDGSIRWLAPVERAIYRVCGIDPVEDQHWTRYAGALLLFSAASMLFTYLALRVQHLLRAAPRAHEQIVALRQLGRERRLRHPWCLPLRCSVSKKAEFGKGHPQRGASYALQP